MPDILLNRYVQKTADRDGSCFICSKPTTCCLTNTPLVTDPSAKDWFFICLNHIKDPTCCKCLNPDPPPPTPSASATAEALRKKKEAEKLRKEKAKADAEAKKKVEKALKDKDSKASNTDETHLPEPPDDPVPKMTPPPPVTIKEYELNSQIFYHREAAVRQKAKTVQNKQSLQNLGGLPSVPKGFKQ